MICTGHEIRLCFANIHTRVVTYSMTFLSTRNITIEVTDTYLTSLGSNHGQINYITCNHILFSLFLRSFVEVHAVFKGGAQSHLMFSLFISIFFCRITSRNFQILLQAFQVLFSQIRGFVCLFIQATVPTVTGTSTNTKTLIRITALIHGLSLCYFSKNICQIQKNLLSLQC